MIKHINIRGYEKGLRFRNGEFKAALGTGTHWIWDPFSRATVDVVSQRELRLQHPALAEIVKSGALAAETLVVDLKDQERAILWVDGRFGGVLDSGLHVLWTRFHEVKADVVDARKPRFEHPLLELILKAPEAGRVLTGFAVPEGHTGAYFKNGEFVELLPPGQYAAWQKTGTFTLHAVDVRESVLDVAGQEILTADKVSLRINVLLTYRIRDVRKALAEVSEVKQALYREAQLALRAEIGTRELDGLLAAKDEVGRTLATAMRRRAPEYGVEITGFGIRDLILPGEMKSLLNKVVEARKAAEANAITRREETATMRSQLNTAKLFEENPALLRLRELEILEKVAANSKLNIMLAEKSLSERIMTLV